MIRNYLGRLPQMLDSKVLQRLKLRERILVSYAIPVLTATCSTALIFYELSQTNTYLNNSKVIRTVSSLLFQIQSASNSVKYEVAAVLFADGERLNTAATIEKEQQERFIQIQNILKANPRLLNFGDIETKLMDLQRLLQKSEQLSTSLVNMSLLDGRVTEARNIWVQSETQKIFLDTEKLMNELISLVSNKSDLERDLASRSLSLSIAYSLVTLGIIALASPVLGIWIANLIAGAIAKTVQEISSLTAQVSAFMLQQEEVISQQVVSVNETTTTMEELRVASRQSAERAVSAAENAEKVAHLAKGGKIEVDKTMLSIAAIKDSLLDISHHIKQLSQQTAQIFTIADIVADLATRTNILALNATLEATRAGVHGKGFAVLAKEVRNLAEQARSSAVKIGFLIKEVQVAIESTVSVTEKGTTRSTESVMFAESTLNKLQDIIIAVEKISYTAQQIALNAKQQVVGVQQVVSAMETIHVGAQETEDSIVQLKLAVRHLKEVAQLLQAQV